MKSTPALIKAVLKILVKLTQGVSSVKGKKGRLLLSENLVGEMSIKYSLFDKLASKTSIVRKVGSPESLSLSHSTNTLKI